MGKACPNRRQHRGSAVKEGANSLGMFISFPDAYQYVYQGFGIFESAGATFTPPRLDAMYEKPGAWEVLQERWAAR